MAYKFIFNALTGKFDIVRSFGSQLTNNVSSGGTSGTISDFKIIMKPASGGLDTVDALDVPSKSSVEDALELIRGDIYQLTQRINQIISS